MLTAFGDEHLYGQTFGKDSPKVMLLHGWQRSSSDFKKLGDCLADKYKIASIALDLPGFGSSRYEFGGSSQEGDKFVAGSLDYANKLMTVIDKEFDNLVVLGHSFGGRVAIRLQTLAKNKVKGLLLTGVPIIADPAKPKVKPNKVLAIYKKLNRLKLVPDSKVEALKMRYGSVDYRNAVGALRDTLVKVIAESNSGIYLDDLRQSDCKIQLIWGAEDQEINIRVPRQVLSELSLRKIDLITLESTGHMAPLEQPQDFARIISDMVSEVL